MPRTKKLIEDGENKKGRKVIYEDVKPTSVGYYNRDKYLAFLEVYHVLRPYLQDRKPNVSKEELLARFPKKKKLVDEVWECVHDLKLIWPNEIANRILEES